MWPEVAGVGVSDKTARGRSMNPEFMAMNERSRALHKPGTGLSLEHVRRRLGMKRPSARKIG
jgi:hypothetical protein